MKPGNQHHNRKAGLALKHLRLIFVGVWACGVILGETVAAQDRSSSSQVVAKVEQLEEVVVTARRREENNQSVPISVTAIGGEALTRMGINDAFDLTNHVPSLRVQAAEINPRIFTVGLRGLRTLSYLMLDDPAVGTYFAEVVVAHPYGFGANFYDLQSVQVLKGPQGTLFGRNTTGGAILVEPNRPIIGSGDVGGKVKLSLGDYRMRKFEGVVNLPLGDTAAARIAILKHERKGYTTNDLTGQKLDGLNNNAVRISLLARPNDSLSSSTVMDYLKDDGSPNSSALVTVYPGGGSSYNSANSPNPTNGPANALVLLAAQDARGPRHVVSALGTNGFFDGSSPVNCIPPRACRAGSVPTQNVVNWGFLNNTEYRFENGSKLKNIFSYRYAEQRTDGNTYSPGGLVAVGTQSILTDNISQWSDELQLSGQSFGDKLEWTTGYFAMREWGKDRTITYTFSAAPPVQQVTGGAATGTYNSNWTGSWADGVNNSEGFYAQGTYHLAERLKATVGVRRNFDRRYAVDLSPSGSGTTCFIAVPSRDNPAVCAMSDTRKWAQNTYTASLEYQWRDDTLLYAATRKGYKSGGFSLRAHARSRFIYNPEFVTDYEVGAKSDWKLAGMPVRTNLAAYRSNLTSMQVQVSDASVTPIITYTDNVGKGRVTGVEYEMTLLPSKNWELSGYLSYTKPRVLEYSVTNPSTGGVLDLSWRNVIGNGIPKWMGGLTTKYALPLASGGAVSLQADLSVRSATVTSNDYPVSYTGPGSATMTAAQKTTFAFIQPTQAGFGLLNLRADWSRPMGYPVNLGFFVSNVTDVVYKQGGNASGGAVVANFAPPRMFGIDLSYAFGDGFKTTR